MEERRDVSKGGEPSQLAGVALSTVDLGIWLTGE